MYKHVPEFLPGHNRRGKRQTPEHVARRAMAISGTWNEKRLKSALREKNNPFNSASYPREYSAWYHEHHPGYFATKTKEWLDRQPKSRRKALYAQNNKRRRTYVTAYSKLSRRLRRHANSPPSFTAEENVEIDRSPHLTQLLRKVKGIKPRPGLKQPEFRKSD